MNGTPTILGILVVDDNATWGPRVVKLIEDSLPFSNRRARWEGTMKLGLKALEEFHADAVWLDLDLPDSRPLETIAMIGEVGRISGAPVIMFSDHFNDKSPFKDELIMQCMEAGAHSCSTKEPAAVECLIKGLVFRLYRMLRQARQGQNEEAPHATGC